MKKLITLVALLIMISNYNMLNFLKHTIVEPASEVSQEEVTQPAEETPTPSKPLSGQVSA